MTNISTPQQSEYSFRHLTPTEPQAANIKVLDVLNTSKQWEVVTVQGKILEVPAKNLGLWKRSLTMDLGGFP